MRFKVIIPARYAASRLPGKPLADLCGRPLIQRVHQRAQESAAASVIIATDHPGIESTAKGFGARVEMTSQGHASGVDRIAEVVRRLGIPDDEIIVNLQGDEPLMPPKVINQVAMLLASSADASIATLCERITEAQNLFDPNIVKVVMDAAGRALYFSRAPIPWHRQHFRRDVSAQWPLDQPYYRHIGLYAYRAGFLRRCSTLPRAEIEHTEALEQLRALHHGVYILVAEACAPAGFSVDTPADLERVRQLLGAELINT
ncbi:MAG: 3-deoxy-manno-octulosonate cytidylyltransferase [Chromatiales bacterium]